ncbi:unnamed protein product [Adineta steineri]|uniref:Tyrosine-protein kinase ephrin type A/B receptor-like domain-containing protein n=1 Tax=Adineta steineri TaxID=433720 RepID=A0A814TBC9_9BILA|nr:unnamed protein product [Adineta steineri]CAF1159733.1 unnamed protein product [Adineta steineri]
MQPCASGTYQAITGKSSVQSCLQCPIGTYGSTSGQSTCTVCPSGAYCALAASNPQYCASGTYQPVTDGTSNLACLACPAGTFAPNLGVSNCNDCPSGTYCMAGSSSTQACPSATYSAIPHRTSSSACLACPNNSNIGQTTCPS